MTGASMKGDTFAASTRPGRPYGASGRKETCSGRRQFHDHAGIVQRMAEQRQVVQCRAPRRARHPAGQNPEYLRLKLELHVIDHLEQPGLVAPQAGAVLAAHVEFSLAGGHGDPQQRVEGVDAPRGDPGDVQTRLPVRVSLVRPGMGRDPKSERVDDQGFGRGQTLNARLGRVHGFTGRLHDHLSPTRVSDPKLSSIANENELQPHFIISSQTAAAPNQKGHSMHDSGQFHIDESAAPGYQRPDKPRGLSNFVQGDLGEARRIASRPLSGMVHLKGVQEDLAAPSAATR